MRISLKTLLGVVVVVVMVIGLVIWFENRSLQPTVEPESTLKTTDEPDSSPARHSLFSPTRVRAKTPDLDQPPVAPPSSVSNTNVITDWEEKVDAILIDSGDSDTKAKNLLDMFPRLPEAGQIDSVQHLINLTSDESYSQLGRYLAQGNSSAEVLDELMDDLLNRPNSIKLPLLLEIARNPQHPEFADAKEVLTFYLDEDYGDNWTLWGQKLAAWLKDNPD
jgi:hypothetical protein